MLFIMLQIFYNASHPYLVCTQVSLDDLNNRLEEKVGFERFRPNIVVNTNNSVKPYGEVRCTAFLTILCINICLQIQIELLKKGRSKSFSQN